MSDDYAPEAGGAREDFTYPWEGLNPGRRGRLAAFVRWMVEHDRQVAEKAWDEGYKDRGGVVVDIYGDVTETRENPYRSTALRGVQEESKA